MADKFKIYKQNIAYFAWKVNKCKSHWKLEDGNIFKKAGFEFQISHYSEGCYLYGIFTYKLYSQKY